MQKVIHTQDGDFIQDDATGDLTPVSAGTTPTGTDNGSMSTKTSTITFDDKASPWGTPPSNGDWQSWFLQNIGSTPPSPDALAKLEPELSLAGVKVLKNASGLAGKIQLPNGQIIDVGRSFSSGNPSQMGWQWLSGDNGPGTEGTLPGGGSSTPDAYTALARPDYLQGPYVAPTWGENFVPPTADSLKNDPGYQARLDATQRGFERSAAAKGSLLSGGFIGRTLPNALGTEASQEYNNAFGRAYDTYKQRYGQFTDASNNALAARGVNENAYENDVANNLSQYNTRYRTYRDAVDDQFRLSQLGLTGITAGAPS